MQIKVLGPGCARCEEVYKRTIEVLQEMNLACEVEKVKDIKQIMEYRILATPGLIVNGKVKCAGKIPAKSQIKKWVEEERTAAT
jgi:small redox-active disulfide protein 2